MTSASDFDRAGELIACHHSDHYDLDGLPGCKGDACKGWTVACGQGMIACERHQPANRAQLTAALDTKSSGWADIDGYYQPTTDWFAVAGDVAAAVNALDFPAASEAPSLDHCPTCGRRITDFDPNGAEGADGGDWSAQRHCLDHPLTPCSWDGCGQLAAFRHTERWEEAGAEPFDEALCDAHSRRTLDLDIQLLQTRRHVVPELLAVELVA